MTASPSPRDIPVAEQLYQLQVEQLKHDEAFHKDVVIMPLADRVKHMALHNAKYVGYLVGAVDGADAVRFQAVLTDAFIITLATANTLNQDLGKTLDAVASAAVDVSRLGEVFAEQLGRHADDPFAFVKAYAQAAGGLAKACESWDHMEDVPFLTLMCESNVELFRLVVAEAALRSLDMEALYRARLRVIERRSIFHPTLAAGPR